MDLEGRQIDGNHKNNDDSLQLGRELKKKDTTQYVRELAPRELHN